MHRDALLRPALTFAVAVATSGSVWALSPLLAGRAEPWDASGAYYVVALAVAGAISGALSPRPVAMHYLGAVVGQSAYQVLVLGAGPLFLVGLLFLLAYSIVFLAAAAVAAWARVRYMRGGNAT